MKRSDAHLNALFKMSTGYSKIKAQLLLLLPFFSDIERRKESRVQKASLVHERSPPTISSPFLNESENNRSDYVDI